MAPSGDGSGERGSGPSGPQPHDGIPAAGDVIADKYQVERVLGVGGMGVVLAARHLQLGQRVAIKFMVEAFAQDARAVERFVREARAAVALSSEHVARVIDVGTLESGAPYMVMEYLTGRDLSEVLRSGGPLDISRAVDLVLQACDGVADAHAIGIVHRDLKPSNLFVTSRRDGSPWVKVLDFGISKATGGGPGASQTLTDSGMVMGSPLYMSPEQARSAKSADARSDVWALGVIVYQLLTGKTPFEGDTLGETLARILSEDAPPLRQKRPDAPAGLDAIVARCLERDVRRRVQSVTELAQLLVPFASRESALLVERLSRSSPPVRADVSATIAADGPAAPLPTFSAAPSDSRARREETGPPWLRSGPGTTAARRPLRRVLPWIGGAVVIAAGALTLTMLRSGHVTDPAAASGTAESPPPPAPPVVPTPPPTHAVVVPAEELAPPKEEQPAARPSERATVDAGAPAAAAAAEARPGHATAPHPHPSHPATTPSSKPAAPPTNTVPDFGY
jgi:serine/threonine-protein kinase